MRFLLPLLILPFSASAEDQLQTAQIPPIVAKACEADPRADTGLVHFRCGERRLLVAQVREMDTDLHEEILVSVNDLVPAPASRTDLELPDPDLHRTTLVQDREAMVRGDVSVHLQLTTRRSDGRSLACMVGVSDRKRLDQRELEWCELVTAAMLPAPATGDTTQVVVEVPDLPPEELP